MSMTPDRRGDRQQWTHYGLSGASVEALHQFADHGKSFASGEAFVQLRNRGLCDRDGEYKISRADADIIVKNALREGWSLPRTK